MTLTRIYLDQQRNWSWGFFRLNDRFSSKFGRFVREERTGALLVLVIHFPVTIVLTAECLCVTQR